MTHRLLTSAVTLSLLFPSVAFAALEQPRSSILDQVIIFVDAAFGYAQGSLRSSPLSDEQKGSVSNVLKTKHDTVKNSINNVR